MRQLILLSGVLLLAPTSSRSVAHAEPLPQVVQAGADFLLGGQGWYRGSVATDRGKKRRILRNVWQWQKGQVLASSNFGGIVGLGMLDAYQMTGDSAHFDSALLYGMALVNDFRAFRSMTLPYRPDIEFLVRLSEMTGDDSYREAAGAWFRNLKHVSPSGAHEVARLLRLRSGGAQRYLVGYDLAFGIHAALALGDVVYAQGLADAAWAKRVAWMAPKSGQHAWDSLSRAALARAFQALDQSRYAKPVEQLCTALMAIQGKNGAWHEGATQATAYAVRALLAAAHLPGATEAASRAARWLAVGQADDGEWSEFAARRAYNPTVQSEALSAYAAFLGHGDR